MAKKWLKLLKKGLFCNVGARFPMVINGQPTKSGSKYGFKWLKWPKLLIL